MPIAGGAEVPLEPGAHEPGNALEVPGFLEQVGRAVHDLQAVLARQLRRCPPVHADDRPSSPPTMRSVGARTRGGTSIARPGRPLRDSTAATCSGRSAAAAGVGEQYPAAGARRRAIASGTLSGRIIGSAAAALARRHDG